MFALCFICGNLEKVPRATRHDKEHVDGGDDELVSLRPLELWAFLFFRLVVFRRAPPKRGCQRFPITCCCLLFVQILRIIKGARRACLEISRRLKVESEIDGGPVGYDGLLKHF